MFTLFTIPKAVEGHIGVIQRDALGGWARLRPACEVFVFGDEAARPTPPRESAAHMPGGRAQRSAARSWSAICLAPQRTAPATASWSTPTPTSILLDDLGRAPSSACATSPVPALRPALEPTGRRPARSSTAKWVPRLRAAVARDEPLAIPGAIDYFAFPRDMFGPMPPFAVGRVSGTSGSSTTPARFGAPLIERHLVGAHRPPEPRLPAPSPAPARGGAAQDRPQPRARPLPSPRPAQCRASARPAGSGARRTPPPPAPALRPAESLPSRLPRVRALYRFWRRRVRGLTVRPGSGVSAHAGRPGDRLRAPSRADPDRSPRSCGCGCCHRSAGYC